MKQNQIKKGYINNKTNRTKVNNIISNPIYPLFDSKLNNLIIREEIPKRKIVHNDEDEKEDDHIKELLKGHKIIIINKKNVKKKRKINNVNARKVAKEQWKNR